MLGEEEGGRMKVLGGRCLGKYKTSLHNTHNYSFTRDYTLVGDYLLIS